MIGLLSFGGICLVICIGLSIYVKVYWEPQRRINVRKMLVDEGTKMAPELLIA